MCLSICVCLSVCLSVYLSVVVSNCLAARPFVCFCPCVCPADTFVNLCHCFCRHTEISEIDYVFPLIVISITLPPLLIPSLPSPSFSLLLLHSLFPSTLHPLSLPSPSTPLYLPLSPLPLPSLPRPNSQYVQPAL